MTRPLQGIKPAISYTLPEASLATGIGETKLREAIEDGALERHYSGRVPVILAQDLIDFVAALPTERAS